MPEIISKYPDIVLQILKEAGIQCGTGAKQQILVNCHAEKFCSLPTGELCVYGLNDIPKMTQISGAELANAAIGAKVPFLTIEVIILVLIAFIVGVIIGFLIIKRLKTETFK
jgi:hypothetical protein